MICGPNGCELRSKSDLGTITPAEKPGHRVLFIGTSQTIGAGAEKLEKTFFSRVHYMLSAGVAPIPLESLNVSASGSNSERLLKDYAERYIQFHPDLVVINLSNNDRPENFEKGLSSFLELNARGGIKTVLIQEANSPEAKDVSALLDKHKTMRILAERYRVPVYSLHEFLGNSEVSEGGFLWWDPVHLTSYGQDVVSRWLAPKLLSVLVSIPRPSVS